MSAVKPRTSLSVESLGDRIVPAFIPTVVPNPTGVELKLTGDAAPDDAQITDYGNGIVNVVANGGASNWTYLNVNQITVNSEDGDDRVTYDLVNSPLANRSQKLVVGLGSNLSPNPGDDVFLATVKSGVAIDNFARLEIQADGGGGNDTMRVIAANVRIGATGWMKTTVTGGYGDDVVDQYYTGEVDGSFAMRSHGSDGADNVRQYMSYAAGSTGVTGAIVSGGLGRDTVGLFMYTQPAMTVTAATLYGDLTAADAGYFDVLNFTPNVDAFQ